jgi:serine/threonine-protein kinase
MAITTLAELTDLLRDSTLLQPGQFQLIASDLQTAFADPRAAADMLIRRKWLTSYQADQLLSPQGQSLMLGSYILLEPLGEGGMGQVFKARHTVLERVVALKTIREERLSKDPEAVGRFRREARSAAALSHPNIVLVYDADRSGETYFIAMEYIEGTDLSRWVKDTGPLPIAQACDFIRQAALGLQHAHEAGMVHRDIKPSNLLAAGLLLHRPQPTKGLIGIGAAPAIPGARMPRGAPGPADRTPVPVAPVIKILDMGLVRMAKGDEHSSASLTQEGSIVGTPDYIAPEQARNAHRVDIRADLYSLGCTFYYLLTGQPPFAEGSAVEKLLMHQLDEPVPVNQLRPQVPREVAAVVHKLLAKFPRDRYQTPGELAELLSKLAPAPQSPSVRVTPGKKLTETRSLAVHPARPEPQSKPKSLSDENTPRFAPLPKQTLPMGPPPVSAKATPPDSAPPRIVPREAAPSPPSAARPPLSPPTPAAWHGLMTPHPGQLAAREAVTRQAPDTVGQDLAAGKDEAKHIAHLKGHAGCVVALAFAPNRDTLASGGLDSTIRIWDFTGKKPRERSCLRKHRDAVNALAYSPDNRTLASGSGAMDGLIWIWNMAEEQPKEKAVLQGHQGPVDALAFAPDCKTIASGSEDLTVRIWEVIDRQVKPRATLKGHARGIKSLAFSRDGSTLASAAQDYTVRIWNIKSMWSKERALLQHPGEVYSLSFSPDGTLLATACQDQIVRLWDLTSAPKPTERAAFKGHTGTVRLVLFTADGKTLVGIGEGRQVIHWEVETAVQIREWQIPKFLNPCFAVTLDGRYLANGATDGHVDVYRVAEKRERSSH